MKIGVILMLSLSLCMSCARNPDMRLLTRIDNELFYQKSDIAMSELYSSDTSGILSDTITVGGVEQQQTLTTALSYVTNQFRQTNFQQGVQRIKQTDLDSNRVDVLLIIDDSPSMKENIVGQSAHDQIRQNFKELIAILHNNNLNWNIRG